MPEKKSKKQKQKAETLESENRDLKKNVERLETEKNRAAKAKYRNHLTAEHNANGHESKEVPTKVDSGDESEGSDDESGSSSDSSRKDQSSNQIFFTLATEARGIKT